MKIRCVLLLLSTLSLIGAFPALAAPRSEPWPLWERHDDASTQVVDHAAWGRFLATYVRPGPDQINRVAYGAVPKQETDALAADVQRQAALPISRYSRREQRAYWTNLYNELTVLTVLQHYPVTSIRDIGISPGLLSSGPWDAKLIEVEGTKLTLNDIEHRILRPIWRDPRTHYSLNCASLGCPNLQKEPYAAATMEAALDRGAQEHVNSPRGFHVQAGQLTVSSIYVWYKADFGGTDQGVIEHLRRYAAPAKTQTLAGVSSVSNDIYDWRLNDAASR